MPILRSSSQKTTESLQEFYERMATWDSPHSKETANSMLAFIELIDSLFKETTIWGLTSHARLVLQAKDDWQSDWLVIVCGDGQEFYFEYLVPRASAPWLNARVQGIAKSMEQAGKYLLIAMRECEGWKGNPELELLLDTIQ